MQYFQYVGAITSTISDPLIAPVDAPPVLDGVVCTRSEKRLMDCSYDNIAVVSSRCRRDANYAAVKCPSSKPLDLYTCSQLKDIIL